MLSFSKEKNLLNRGVGPNPDSLIYFHLHLSIIQFSYLHKIAYLETERIREKQTTNNSKLR